MDDFTPWTAAGRHRLLRASTALSTAILEHARLVAALEGSPQLPQVFQAGDQLLSAALAYKEAQFDLTGTAYPLGLLGQLQDDGLSEDSGAGDDGVDRATTGLTVLARADYAVLDESSIIAAGRAAYRELWPDDNDEAAAADVSHLGRALYQVTHAHGWWALAGTDGLQATGAATVVLRQEHLLSADPDQWPEDLFAADGEFLHAQQDVYPQG